MKLSKVLLTVEVVFIYSDGSSIKPDIHAIGRDYLEIIK